MGSLRLATTAWCLIVIPVGCAPSESLSLPQFADAAGVSDLDAGLELDPGPFDTGPFDDAGEEASSGDVGPFEGDIPDSGPPPAEGRIDVLVEANSIWRYPRTGLQVLFHSADGEVLTTTVTDAQGQASAVVPRHGMVTVIDESRSWRAHTITGLEPPEAIRIAPVGRPQQVESVGQTQVVLQELSSLEQYSADSGLSRKTGESPRIPMTFFGEHLDPSGSANVLAFGHEGSGRPANVFTYVKNVVVTDRLFLMIPGWRSDWAPLVFNWTRLDPSARDLRFDQWVGLNGRRYKVDGRKPGDGRTGSVELQLPRGFGDSYSFQLIEESDGRERVLVRGLSSIPLAIDVDLTADNLPYISAVEVTDNGTDRPSVVYLAPSAAGLSDIVRVTFGYRAPLAGSHAWYVYAEPTSLGTIRLPALPSEEAFHRPLDVTNGTVDLIDSSIWRNYRDARRNLPFDTTSYERRCSSMGAN